MICRNCGAFFIRYPCPSCGQKEAEILASQPMEIIFQEERLIKPSELKGGSSVSKSEIIEEVEQSLLKPSQMSPGRKIDPSNPFNEERDAIIKPSQLAGSSAVNPNFKAHSTSKVTIEPARHRLQPIQTKISQIDNKIGNKSVKPPARLDGETEEQYKLRVRDTLLEVMSLLEKLME